MKINLVYDASVTKFAPVGFTSALQYAANELDALITDNVTINIGISWDTTGTILGEARPWNGQTYSYAQVVNALKAHASTSAAITAADSLPAADPTRGSGVYLTIAQQEALGLLSGTALPDGTCTFGTAGTTLNFSTTTLAVSNEEDFNGVALHELTHALGRSGWGTGSNYSLLDLYRISSNGSISTSTASLSYFSIDGGKTDTGTFSTYSDPYDWAATMPGDSYDAVAYQGVANTLSAADQTLLSAIGFNVACFCPGTRIATPQGEVRVEAFSIGDEVLTRAGPRRIKWLGRSAYDGRFLGDNPLMLPVIFAPGALGDGVPARPLTVSPGHGVAVGDVLVPAWRLVNGASVTQPAQTGPVSYIHIELDQHGLLLSEGAWSESYLNVTPRSWFQNAAEYDALYPGEDMPGAPCLERVEDGLALEALRDFVNSRAGLPRCAEGTGALRGYFEQMGPGHYAGWAQSAEAPEVPVTLLAMQGGKILARFVANSYRPELCFTGAGRGCNGFAVALPDAGGIVIRRALDGAILPLKDRALAA